MARIDIRVPLGEMPKVEDHQLSQNYAGEARNMDLRNATWKTYKAPLDLSQPILPATKTIYRYNPDSGGFLFQFDNVVDVIRGPIASDTNLMTYIFGDGVPKFTVSSIAQTAAPYPSATYDLGIPVPVGAISVTGPAIAAPDDVEVVTTNYVVTYIDQFGAEGPPSSVTVTVDRWDGQPVNLSNIPVSSGNFIIATKRIYRSELSGEFLFVADIGAAVTTYDDSVNSNLLGTVLPSTNWFAPDPLLEGAIALPNGGIMGWNGNTISFSEPFRPHAWPPEYEQGLDFDVVGASVTSSGILVATTGKPYVITGIDPSSMGADKIDAIQACVSRRSIVDMGGFAIYASSDGLVAAGGAEAKLISEDLITPEQFRALNPASFDAYRYDERYLAFYDNGVDQGALMFSPKEGFIFFDQFAEAGYVDRETGRLYLKQGTALTAWNEGAQLEGRWRSKLFQSPQDQFLSVAKVDANSYPQTLEFFRDGISIKTIAVQNNKGFRLPSRSRYRDDQFDYRGTGEVTRVQLASSMSELI